MKYLKENLCFILIGVILGVLIPFHVNQWQFYAILIPSVICINASIWWKCK